MLRNGRLILASLNTVTLALSAYVCGLLYISFTNVVCIHSICYRFWMPVTVSSCYCLERVWPSGLQPPSSPLAYSYVPHWCGLCPSALAHSCRMASPVPLQTASHCHDVLRVACLLFSAFVNVSLQTTCSILRSTVRRQVWSTSFPSPWVAMFVMYNRQYNAAHMDCDIVKIKKTYVYRGSDPNASGLFLREDLFEHLSNWALLIGMNLCRVELPWPVRICVGFSHFDRYESLWGLATLTSRKVWRVELPWPARVSVGWATLTSKTRRSWAILAGKNLCWVELLWSVRIFAELTYLDWPLSWLPSVPQDNCRTYIELYHDSFLRSPFYFVTNHFTNRRQCKLLSAFLQKT
jgi:hypothetical protein